MVEGGVLFVQREIKNPVVLHSGGGTTDGPFMRLGVRPEDEPIREAWDRLCWDYCSGDNPMPGAIPEGLYDFHDGELRPCLSGAGLDPMTPEEAQAAYDAAPSIPLTAAEIESIVRRVLTACKEDSPSSPSDVARSSHRVEPRSSPRGALPPVCTPR